MEKMSMSDRAKQFMPFAALRGYYTEIRKKEVIKGEKRELTEEEALELDKKVLELKKGDMVSVTYYREGKYRKEQGLISQIDLVLKTLTLVKNRIKFSDIFNIEKEGL